MAQMIGLDMSPASASADLANGSGRYAEPRGQLLSSQRTGSDLKNVVFGKPGRVMLCSASDMTIPAGSAPAFGIHVGCVVGSGSDKQVFRTNAGWSIALVEDVQARGDWLDECFVGEAVRINKQAVEAQAAVAGGELPTCPDHTVTVGCRMIRQHVFSAALHVGNCITHD